MPKYDRPLNTHTKPELQKNFTKIQLTDYIKELERMNANQVGMLEKAFIKEKTPAKTARAWKANSDKWEKSWEYKTKQADEAREELATVKTILKEVRDEKYAGISVIKNLNLTITNATLAGKLQRKKIEEQRLISLQDMQTIERLRDERKEFFAIAVIGGK